MIPPESQRDRDITIHPSPFPQLSAGDSEVSMLTFRVLDSGTDGQHTYGDGKRCSTGHSSVSRGIRPPSLNICHTLIYTAVVSAVYSFGLATLAHPGHSRASKSVI